MSNVEITLVRHARSVSNESGVWQGHGDSPLSERGQAQARALAERMKLEDFDLILSSDLMRAHDTARASYQDKVQPLREWREIDVGDWEGLSMEQVIERFPEQLLALKQREPVSIGGGESWLEVFDRADGALRAMRERLRDGQRGIVFTHGGVMAAIMAGLLDARERWPWPLGRVYNTAITRLLFRTDNVVEIRAHNSIRHLKTLEHDALIASKQQHQEVALIADAQAKLAPTTPEALSAMVSGQDKRLSLAIQPDAVRELACAIAAPPQTVSFAAAAPDLHAKVLLTEMGPILLSYEAGSISDMK